MCNIFVKHFMKIFTVFLTFFYSIVFRFEKKPYFTTI